MVQMMGSLYDSIENDYGAFATRLYRAFRPKSGKHVKDFMIMHYMLLLWHYYCFFVVITQRGYDVLGIRNVINKFILSTGKGKDY